jgi:hypothetical protein
MLCAACTVVISTLCCIQAGSQGLLKQLYVPCVCVCVVLQLDKRVTASPFCAATRHIARVPFIVSGSTTATDALYSTCWGTPGIFWA